MTRQARFRYGLRDYGYKPKRAIDMDEIERFIRMVAAGNTEIDELELLASELLAKIAKGKRP